MDIRGLNGGNFTLWARITLNTTASPTNGKDLQKQERWEDDEKSEQNDYIIGENRQNYVQHDGNLKTDAASFNETIDIAYGEGKTGTSIGFDTVSKITGVNNKLRPISSFLPKGGNTLPNFFTKGLDLGLRPKDYQKGIIAFLHHNKAAGSSVKLCLLSMTRRGVIKDHYSSCVVSSKKISSTEIKVFQKYAVFVGGYTFWLCEQFESRNCSYFTIMRNPYDRILSSYFYCQNQPWDQLCGPLQTGNFTIQEWALYQGSYFFNQLLMNRDYCQPNDDLRHLFNRGFSDFIPPNAGHYISYESAKQCWFRQKVFLTRNVNETGRMHLLQNVLDNLESWFSVIGMTDEFDLSLKMLSFTYELPFLRRCRGKIINKGNYAGSGKSEQENMKEMLKSALHADSRVVEALKYDVMIYERGLQIFERQKKRLESLLAKKIQT
ncbi:hypothetical protein HOLleu_01821 [Holothuria leucospilota]|uniref:Sulfotransferase n=1 Tax=Holothuria leucospilota TaxID=206669 RepID=A0A9Q1CQF9_HOLLE|nr:hypothetical protein HOLleu_01821 [Holothuria leucospilota]